MPTPNTSGPPARRDSGGSGPVAIGTVAVVLIGLAVTGYVLAPNLYPPTVGPDAPLAIQVAAESARLAAITSARARVVAILAGIGALATILINYRNSRVALDTFRVAERGHLTDRYGKAIEQLGDDKLAVRLGGIYGLQQYAEDSSRDGDQRTVVEVLSAFIRDKLDGFGGSDPGRGGTPEADVLAAVGVLAQLPVRNGVVRAYIPGSLFHSVNISGARLKGGNLSGVRMNTVGIRSADLTDINLDGADFDNAALTRCDLTGASLRKTIFRTGQLSYSKLHNADLEGADLGTVTCEETEFIGANLRGADLGNVNMEWAILRGADLRDTFLMGARFHGAVLNGADFAGARELVDGQLTAKQIAAAKNLPRGLLAAEQLAEEPDQGA